jgi:hypothetical protein
MQKERKPQREVTVLPMLCEDRVGCIFSFGDGES